MKGSISSQFNSFFIDVKEAIVNLINNIHNFLNLYLDDTAIGIFGIIVVAGILIFIFRKISKS